MVGQPHNGLLVHLVTHLGPAQHHLDVGALGFEQAQQRLSLRHVPDVHAKANNLRRTRLLGPEKGQQLVQHLLRAPGYRELAQHGTGFQITHIGQQITQAQRGVDVLGIQSAQNNRRHASGGR